MSRIGQLQEELQEAFKRLEGLYIERYISRKGQSDLLSLGFTPLIDSESVVTDVDYQIEILEEELLIIAEKLENERI